MDWQAQQASQGFEQTGQITVIVQDNHPIHLSKKIRERWSYCHAPRIIFLPTAQIFLTNESD